MSFTMDNGLFVALFRLECIIVERYYKSMMLQWDFYVEKEFLRVAGLLGAIVRNGYPHCNVGLTNDLARHSVFPNDFGLEGE
jgi:hypothetical protein